jgi:serine/threonine-protein kinase
VIGTTLNQRFALEKELGRGGMGTVYRATDLILQRSVAIKVLKEISGEEVGRRIRLEAQITARLEHQNVVRLYDFGADGPMYYFVMEEVDGTSFQKRWKKIEPAERVTILAQVADALNYAHHKGLIHRDVKPGNVLLTSADLAKLSDFGLSLDAAETQESGIVRGTPHYMSPEQAKGKKLDHRTDIYALGVMLYECATGVPPFQGTLMAIMSQHVNADPEAPRARNPEISEEYERFINRMMAKTPESRPSSCQEVADELRRLVAENRLRNEETGTRVPFPSPPSRPGDFRPGGIGDATPRSPATGMGPIPSSTGSGMPSSEVATRKVSVIRGTSLDARDMIDVVEAEPIQLSADDRYLCGHYLAYLLGGSRRQGFLRRRPLDPLNADRARLMVGMAYVCMQGGTAEAIARAGRLLDERPDVRPAMSPILVTKYLTCRSTPAKRKQFREVRRQLQDASEYAAVHLCDEQGVLNPGLMPQRMSDLTRVAPERSEVDDQLVQRWNRVTEVWRGNPAFREAVLRYATRGAHRDPSSVDLWPEVVYPLIERARWQRRLRSGTEKVLDAISVPLHLPQAGMAMDRIIRQSVPEAVIAKLDVSLDVFEDDPSLGEPAAPAADQDAERLSHHHLNAQNYIPEEADAPTRDFVRLSPPDPIRLTHGELRALWQEGLAALRQPGAKPAGRVIPIGPYRLTVVASIRSRSAGQAAIQGMPNKQVEMLVPSFTGGGSGTRPTVAAWTYANNCMVVTYNDHMNLQKYILWDAVGSQQHNFDDAAALNHQLFQMGLEVPDSLDRVLSKSYRPKNPV